MAWMAHWQRCCLSLCLPESRVKQNGCGFRHVGPVKDCSPESLSIPMDIYWDVCFWIHTHKGQLELSVLVKGLSTRQAGGTSTATHIYHKICCFFIYLTSTILPLMLSRKPSCCLWKRWFKNKLLLIVSIIQMRKGFRPSICTLIWQQDKIFFWTGNQVTAVCWIIGFQGQLVPF